MKYTILLIATVLNLCASVIKTPIVAVDNDKGIAKIEIDHIDVGVSGFIVHHIATNKSVILKNVTVLSYDKEKKRATLAMSDFIDLKNSSLPSVEYKPQVKDSVELAFGYSRALLVAPSEKIYYKISKSVSTQWIHPDLFATTLSFAGHPAPLHSDFVAFSNALGVGLLFIYLDSNVYTLDMKSFKILNITKTPFSAEKKEKPFYTRVKKIDANWWGEGSDEMKEYNLYYYTLLVQNNSSNRALFDIVKDHKELKGLIENFSFDEKK